MKYNIKEIHHHEIIENDFRDETEDYIIDVQPCAAPVEDERGGIYINNKKIKNEL